MKKKKVSVVAFHMLFLLEYLHTLLDWDRYQKQVGN